MTLFKCYFQYVSKFGKLSSGHRTGQGQFSFQEFLDVQDGFRKGRGTRDQIANTHWIIEKAEDL